MCPLGYHHNGFTVTHAHEHMMYRYTLLVPMNQRVFNKLSKEPNISGHKWSTTHKVLKPLILRSLIILLSTLWFIGTKDLRTWGFSMKFSGKMWFIIILKATKKQGFTLSVKVGQIKPPTFLGLNPLPYRYFMIKLIN